MSDRNRNREESAGPIGTMVGATLGPLGAAVGTVVNEDRFAFKLSVGTGANDDDGMDDATTIEIEEAATEDESAEAENEADEPENAADE
jgi:hypothetical protein